MLIRFSLPSNGNFGDFNTSPCQQHFLSLYLHYLHLGSWTQIMSQVLYCITKVSIIDIHTWSQMMSTIFLVSCPRREVWSKVANAWFMLMHINNNIRCQFLPVFYKKPLYPCKIQRTHSFSIYIYIVCTPYTL